MFYGSFTKFYIFWICCVGLKDVLMLWRFSKWPMSQSYSLGIEVRHNLRTVLFPGWSSWSFLVIVACLISAFEYALAWIDSSKCFTSCDRPLSQMHEARWTRILTIFGFCAVFCVKIAIGVSQFPGIYDVQVSLLIIKTSKYGTLLNCERDA